MKAVGRIAGGAGHQVKLVPMNAKVYPDVAYEGVASLPRIEKRDDSGKLLEVADEGGNFVIEGVELDHAPLRVFHRPVAGEGEEEAAFEESPDTLFSLLAS